MRDILNMALILKSLSTSMVVLLALSLGNTPVSLFEILSFRTSVLISYLTQNAC